MRPALHQWAVLTFVGLSACDGGQFAVPPPLADAKALVIFDEAQMKLHSAALETGWSLDLPYRTESEITALVYGCELTTLGLAPGERAIEPDGEPLLAPLAAFNTDDPSAGWEPTTVDDALLKKLRVGGERDPGCAQFNVTTTLVGTAERDGRLALVMRESGSAIIGVDGQYFEAFSDGSIIDRTGTPGVPTRLAHEADRYGDELVFLTHDPWCLERFTDAGVATASTCAAPDEDDNVSYAWMSGDRTAASPEVFIAHQHTKLFRADRNTFEVVWAPGRSNLGRRLGIVWMRPGEAVSAGLDPVQAVRYRDGEILLEPTGVSDLLDKIQSIAVTEEYGPLIGSSLGVILHRPGPDWLVLQNAPVARARHIIEVGRRIFVLGDTGTTAEVNRNGQACPLGMVFPGEPIRVRPWEHGFVVLSTEVRTRAFVSFVTVEDPVQTCSGS